MAPADGAPHTLERYWDMRPSPGAQVGARTQKQSVPGKACSIYWGCRNSACHDVLVVWGRLIVERVAATACENRWRLVTYWDGDGCTERPMGVPGIEQHLCHPCTCVLLLMLHVTQVFKALAFAPLPRSSGRLLPRAAAP